MLLFMKMNMSKFSSDSNDLLSLKMSLPVENTRSPAALTGMSVLNLMNKSCNTCSHKKAPSVSKSLELISNQILTKFWALLLSDLWLLLFSFGLVTPQKKSSSSSLLLFHCCWSLGQTAASIFFYQLTLMISL